PLRSPKRAEDVPHAIVPNQPQLLRVQKVVAQEARQTVSRPFVAWVAGLVLERKDHERGERSGRDGWPGPPIADSRDDRRRDQDERDRGGQDSAPKPSPRGGRLPALEVAQQLGDALV